MAKIKILIADDHPMFREGVRRILEKEERYKVVGEARDGQEVLELIDKNPVDLVIMDINMPGLDGVETTRTLVRDQPSLKILALTMHREDRYIMKMLKAGALGYILKDDGKEKLLEAVSTVLQGSSYFGHDVSEALLSTFMNKKVLAENQAPAEPKVNLTERELEILKLITANEMTSEEVANRLNISKRTVDTHRKNILVQLGAKNSVGLVKYAIKLGLLE
ncbi:MAG: response regulator [Cyclobacteriaceae bacterium]